MKFIIILHFRSVAVYISLRLVSAGCKGRICVATEKGGSADTSLGSPSGEALASEQPLRLWICVLKEWPPLLAVLQSQKL